MPDTRFALPAIDDPGSTEVGIILLGLDAERLLAGVGFARLADDPALVTQAVDQARHGVAGFGFPGLVAGGCARWRGVRDAVGDPPGTSSPAALRGAWVEAIERVAAAVPEAGPASIAYLTACSLRRGEVDRLADGDGEPDVVLEVPAG
ncbi:DUF6187 family protein [Amycolatopsis sp. NPDC051045]|uniref:DUF6187 family protein n=1 Tax=Amycolatopsis sp. NPDC051045 TaxID=3156922 RepID=UPI003441AB6B